MKQRIREYAAAHGADDAGFGAASAYASPLSPKLETIFPKAKTLIVLAYRETSNCESENPRIAMAGRMGLRDLLKSCNYQVARFVEREWGAKAMAMPDVAPLNFAPEAKFGLISDFSHRHAAVAAGQGNFGRNNLVIHPRLGARVLFSTVLTDLEIPPDPPVTAALCNQCNLCVESCAGGALDEPGKTEQMKCLAQSQPNGIGANLRFWKRFAASAPEEQQKMVGSPEFMKLQQAAMLGTEYHCFRCYATCPVGPR